MLQMLGMILQCLSFQIPPKSNWSSYRCRWCCRFSKGCCCRVLPPLHPHFFVSVVAGVLIPESLGCFNHPYDHFVSFSSNDPWKHLLYKIFSGLVAAWDCTRQIGSSSLSFGIVLNPKERRKRESVSVCVCERERERERTKKDYNCSTNLRFIHILATCWNLLFKYGDFRLFCPHNVATCCNMYVFSFFCFWGRNFATL